MGVEWWLREQFLGATLIPTPTLALPLNGEGIKIERYLKLLPHVRGKVGMGVRWLLREQFLGATLISTPTLTPTLALPLNGEGIKACALFCMLKCLKMLQCRQRAYHAIFMKAVAPICACITRAVEATNLRVSCLRCRASQREYWVRVF